MTQQPPTEFPWVLIGGVLHIATPHCRTYCDLRSGPATEHPQAGHAYPACDACIDAYGVPLDRGPGVINVSTNMTTPLLAPMVTNMVIEQHRSGAPVEVLLRAIAVPAVNTAIKACATARGTLAARGIDICVLPAWDSQPDRYKAGNEISVMVLRVVERR